MPPRSLVASRLGTRGSTSMVLMITTVRRGAETPPPNSGGNGKRQDRVGEITRFGRHFHKPCRDGGLLMTDCVDLVGVDRF